MSIFNRLLPDVADNQYLGSKIAFYGLIALLIPLTFRSLVHFLKEDSGVNSIATILTFAGSPDPNTVIYMFSSQWGGGRGLLRTNITKPDQLSTHTL